MPKKLNTLQQVLNTSMHKEVSMQNILNGRILTNEGWQSFEISREVREIAVLKTVQLLGGYSNTKQRIYNRLMHSRPQHWGLSRIQFHQTSSLLKGRKKIIVHTYTAAQDYPMRSEQYGRI